MTQTADIEDTDLPSEVTDLIADMKEQKLIQIEALGKAVAKRRDEAVSARKQSGIETIWQEDEEYYQGIDEFNIDSHPWMKSATTVGGITRNTAGEDQRCTSFFNITRQFVESASARMGDILLPAGDWNWQIKPTPVQEESSQAAAPSPGMPLVQPPVPGVPPPMPPLGAGSDTAAKADKAQLKIRDWLVECSYHTEVRKVIEDAAKLGTGILKGPFPTKQVARKTTETPEGTTLEMVVKTAPSSKCVDPLDFFPDPACGEDIHDGAYVLERDRLSAKQLGGLKGIDGYIAEQIDKVLDEGPGKRNLDSDIRDKDQGTGADERFEVWYFYGLIDPVTASAMECKLTEEESSKDLVPAIVTLVNDTPIKACINPIDSGEFPYDLMPWQRKAGSPWGIGVARQGRTAQDMLNAAARALMDNASLSAGPQLVLRQNAIRPADGKWRMSARKIWIATEQADIRSVSDAIMPINIPMVQGELSGIIQLSYKMMEDATGIAFLLQGQQGSAPDTVGGMELLHRNASAILRRLARVFDERITEPHIRRFYDWLLLYGPEDCKGDFKIEAVGSTALVEREIQNMETMQMLQMSLNPAFGLDPEKAMEELLKVKRMIPDKFKMDDEKKKQLSGQQAPIPAIEVAKIRSQTDLQIAQQRTQADIQRSQMENQASVEKMRIDTDRDTVYQQTMMSRDQQTAAIRIEELKIKRELALMDYANKHNISIEQIKAKLASDSMKLRTMKELSAMNAATKQTVQPPVEPAGRAPNGKAYEA